MSDALTSPIVGASHDFTTGGWPVVEIFGPTIQGEGPQAGLPCQFVRFGYCDYRCSWCDSMHAVDPEQVRANATNMTDLAIVQRLKAQPEWVVLSGGNPALFDLMPLVKRLEDNGFKSSVETQGSRWKPWLAEVDQLVISPKPPSSGMLTIKHAEERERFMQQAEEAWMKGTEVAVKIVVFDEIDYDWAAEFFVSYAFPSKFMSVGTDQIEIEPYKQPEVHDLKVKHLVLKRYAWLCDKVKMDPALIDVRVLPQLHLLAWGTKLGV